MFYLIELTPCLFSIRQANGHSFSSLNSLFLSAHLINGPFGQSRRRSPIDLAPDRLMNWAETANFLTTRMKDSSKAALRRIAISQLF